MTACLTFSVSLHQGFGLPLSKLFTEVSGQIRLCMS